MKVITRDAKTGGRVVYDIHQIKTSRPSYRILKKDDKDDKDEDIEELKKRIDELEKRIDEISESSESKKAEKEEPDDEEEEEEVEEGEEVEDLGDSESCFKMKKDSFRPVGSLMNLKASTADSISDDQDEITAWNKRMK